MSLGIVLGFWPLLGIRAIEVYHPIPAFCLMIGMLAVLFRAGSRLAPPVPPADRPGDDRQRWGLAAVIVLAVGYAVFFGVYTVQKHLAFHSYAFDLGWQNQAIWTLLHTGNPRVTGYLTILHFSNHFQPLYYLLAPIYALRQDPATMLVLQAVLLAIGAIPLFLIARRKLGNSWIALIVATVYLLYPALHGMNTYDFHGIALLVPILCFLLWFLETGRMGWYWAFFALALITREDAPITLSGVALYQWLALRKPRLGLASLAACIAYFLMTVGVMRALGGYPNLQNYWPLVLPEHQTYTGVALTLVTNPFFVFRHAFFDPDKLVYLLQIFTPVLFLPFFSGKKMVLMAPGLAIILLSGNSPQYSIGFQYSAHLVAAVFFLAICGIEKVGKRWPRIPAAAIAVTLLAAGLVMDREYGLVLAKRFPGFLRPDERQKTAYSMFSAIPGEASVATISRLYPHLSGRTEIYLLDRMQAGTEFVLADLYPPAPASDLYERDYRTHAIDPEEVARIILELLGGTEYGVLRYENGFVLLQRGAATNRNRDVADAIPLQTGEQPEIVPYFRDPAEDVREVRRSESDRLVEFLDRHSAQTILIAGSGNVVEKLSYLGFLDLMKRGSRINTLRGSGSYLAVIRENDVVFELIDNRLPVSASTDSSEELRKVLPDLAVSLRSAGAAAARGSSPGAPETGASIEIDSVEHSLNQRGLNLVALDWQGRVTDQAAFRTGK
ncbi:MAG: DUF2079 domain-containing protein, partial [Armatimonadetes bacterium]|nr:DUF2079 domain-containing protein [Armatimonadota bacterium]